MSLIARSSSQSAFVPRKFRKSHGKCFGVCGSPASLAAFALAFAGNPASLAAFALAFAGTPASPTGNALVFAGVPQVSREMLWRLRVLPQVSRRLPWRLREFRKSKKERFGICRTSAGHFQKRSGYGVASIETLCWLYSFVELTAKKGAPHFHGDTPLKIDRLRLRYFR